MGKKATQPERELVCDGVLRREIDVEFRSINEDERSFEVVASTETLDSHGDVMRQFWDLSRFEKNGPVLWNHNLALYMGGDAEDTLPIGKATDVRVESKKLVAKLHLVKGDADKEPLVDKIWRRVQQGIQKGVSVGFRPGQVTRKVNAAGETEFYELGSKERPNELREISLVPMGSNPDAVAKSIALERSHLAELVKKDSEVRAAASEPTAERGKAKHMDPELQKAIEAKAHAEKALADVQSELKAAKETAEKNAAEAATKAKQLESDFAAEKKISEKLTSDLATVNKALVDTKSLLAKTELDALQGLKFVPAEREELDKLVVDVGIDRVKSLLAKRADIALAKPVTDAEGKALPAGELPPPAAGADASAELVNLANKAIN